MQFPGAEGAGGPASEWGGLGAADVSEATERRACAHCEVDALCLRPSELLCSLYI